MDILFYHGFYYIFQSYIYKIYMRLLDKNLPAFGLHSFMNETSNIMSNEVPIEVWHKLHLNSMLNFYA